MRHDVRQCERYPVWGMAALIGSDKSLLGQVANISGTGIGLSLNYEREASGSLRNTLLCRVVSPDFPDTLEFLVKVVRKHVSSRGYDLGCAIAAINEKDLAMLEAFQQRRQANLH
ncbi:MAG: PilZ domain-containing protein [Rhodocyclales bacterium]|nr:PilZ domain-containing protein [Rhodocyclales bacterium]